MTIRELEKRLEQLEKTIDKLCKENAKKEYQFHVKKMTSNCTNPEDFLNLVKSKSEEFTDNYGNVYVQLPTIYLQYLGSDEYRFAFEPTNEEMEELIPQAISKYKNSLINGQIRSIPNVAPNFNQMSYNKVTKFCGWVEGEQLNWKTVLYIQIMWAYAYQTKNNNDILPNENWEWDKERDCGFDNTGKGIGEFLGIEQLFTSGRNFVSFASRDEGSDLWKLYALWNYGSNFDADKKLGIWGDYNEEKDSQSAFFFCWNFDFDYAWGNDCSVRLCKTTK